MCFSYEALNSTGEISGLRATKAAIVKDMMVVMMAEELQGLVVVLDRRYFNVVMEVN